MTIGSPTGRGAGSAGTRNTSIGVRFEARRALTVLPSDNGVKLRFRRSGKVASRCRHAPRARRSQSSPDPGMRALARLND